MTSGFTLDDAESSALGFSPAMYKNLFVVIYSRVVRAAADQCMYSSLSLSFTFCCQQIECPWYFRPHPESLVSSFLPEMLMEPDMDIVGNRKCDPSGKARMTNW